MYTIRVTEQIPSIVIPPDLLPIDGRFGSGPSKVPTEAAGELLHNNKNLFGRSHRSSVVSDQVTRLKDGVRELLGAPDDYTIALGNGGASTFWEIAALGLVERYSQHVIQGNFSEKWATAVRSVPGLATLSVRSQGPRVAAPSLFKEIMHTDTDAYALVQNETSVGIKTEIKRPDDQEVLVMVDATSAAGAMEVDIAETDAYFFSLQKAFAGEGGLWVAALSPAALKRHERIARTGRYIPKILDLGVAVESSNKGQTYNTPAVGPIFLAAEQAERLLEDGGLAESAKRSEGMAQTVYGWAEASSYAEPFIIEAADRSPTTPTVQLNGVDAKQVAKILGNNGIYDTAGYRGVKDANMLRIATFPATEPSDVEAALACVDYVVDALMNA